MAWSTRSERKCLFSNDSNTRLISRKKEGGNRCQHRHTSPPQPDGITYIYKATPILPFTTPSLLPTVQTTQLRRPSPPTVPPARLPSTSERTHTHIGPRERKTRAMPPSADRGPSPLRPPTTPFRLDSQMSPIDKDLHPVIHSGRVAVVTGAASGIGAAAAREFAKSVFSRSSRAQSPMPSTTRLLNRPLFLLT